MKVSVLILTFNEENHIEDCLKSVSWADEVIVVDSFSNDRTLKIIKEHNVKIVQEKWRGFSSQRNLGLEYCSNDWVLVVDADERVTPELKKEIINRLEQANDYNGYYIPRKTYFLGKWIKHCGWYPDHVLRLFRKSKGKYKERMVHESVELDGQAGYLSNCFIHYTYRDIEHFVDKMNSYSTLGAKEMFIKGKKVRLSDCMFRPSWALIKMYLLQRGYQDGIRGLIISVISAFYVFLKYIKLWASYYSK